MANITQRAIRQMEGDPHLFEVAMAEIAALMRREQQAADRLDAALRETQRPEESGWIDWGEVIEHFRERASAAEIRDELRRNRRVGLRAEDLPPESAEAAIDDEPAAP